MPFEEKIQHESFGMIQITRVSGGDRNLFGSSIPHGNTIRLSIHHATLSRELNRDWYFADTKAFVEVEMSYTRFAEAIANMNSSGVPVTVRYNAITMEKEPLPAPTAAEMQTMTPEVWERMTEEQQRAYVEEKGIKLGCSTGIADETTCGWGELDFNGYWQYPCDWALAKEPAPQEG